MGQWEKLPGKFREGFLLAAQQAGASCCVAFLLDFQQKHFPDSII